MEEGHGRGCHAYDEFIALERFSMRLVRSTPFLIYALWAVVCALGVAGCDKVQPSPPPPPEVGVVTLKSEPATLLTELPGRIAATQTSEVRRR